MLRKLDFLPFLAIIAIVTCSALLAFTRPPVRVMRISFPVEGDLIGKGILFIPLGLSPFETFDTPPVVFLLPGIISLSDRYRGMAEELSRHGYASLALYFPGKDTRLNLKVLQASARYLEKRHPEIDSKRRAYVGHSLGGTTAVDAAYFDVDARAAISIGYYIGGELAGNPKNVLLGTGIYDDLNDITKMRASLKSVTGGAIDKEGVRMGDFAQRTARELFISPSSNHASEKEDVYVVQRIIEWLDLSIYGNKKESYPCLYQYRAAGAFIIFAGLFILLPYAGIPLYLKHPRIMGILWSAALLMCILLIFITGRAAGIQAYALFFLSGLISTYYSARAVTGLSGFRKGLIKVSAGILLFIIIFSSSQFLFSLNILFAHKSCLYGFPAYIFYAFFITLLSYVESVTVYVACYHPFIPLILLVLGFIVHTYDQMTKGAVIESIFLRVDKLREFFIFKTSKKVTGKEKFAIVALIVPVLLSWLWVYSIGLLNADVILPYIKFIAQYIAFPVAAWLLIFPKIEVRWR